MILSKNVVRSSLEHLQEDKLMAGTTLPELLTYQTGQTQGLFSNPLHDCMELSSGQKSKASPITHQQSKQETRNLDDESFHTCTYCLKTDMDADELKAHAICHIDLNTCQSDPIVVEPNATETWLRIFNDHLAVSTRNSACKVLKTYSKPVVNAHSEPTIASRCFQVGASKKFSRKIPVRVEEMQHESVNLDTIVHTPAVINDNFQAKSFQSRVIYNYAKKKQNESTHCMVNASKSIGSVEDVGGGKSCNELDTNIEAGPSNPEWVTISESDILPIYSTNSVAQQLLSPAQPFLKPLCLDNCPDIELKNAKNPSFLCKKCEKSFVYINEYLNHKKNCSKRRKRSPLFCGVCGRTFLSKQSWNKHINTHSLVPATCTICGKIYPNELMLQTHMINHTGVMPYKCSTCGQEFVYNSIYRNHVLNEHKINEKSFKCDKCNSKFCSDSTLRTHQLKINCTPKDRRCLCPICGKMISNRMGLTGHLKRHDTLKYPCNICGIEFLGKCDLKNHKIRLHSEKSFKCDICGDLFHFYPDVKKHIIVYHTNELPEKCSVCLKEFQFPKTLMRHKVLIHGINETGIPVYKCNICNQAFLRKSRMIDHMNLHTGERPYACTDCEKAFRNRHTLSQHMRLHTKNPLVKSKLCCNLCDKKFKTQRTLLRHKKRVHVNNVDDSSELVCNVCKKAYVNSAMLHQHKLSCGQFPQTYSCTVCAESFSTTATWDHHMKIVHGTLSLIICRVCNQHFSANTELHKHMNKCHGKFKCDHCSKTFHAKQALLQHIKQVHNKAKYKSFSKCKECGKVLSSTTALRSHEISQHSGIDKDLPCDICSKRFKSNARLTAHKLTHMNKRDRKSFPCEICNKELKSLWAHNVHMLIHKKIKPHKCKTCGRSFRQSGDRNKHQKKCQSKSGDQP